MIPLDLDSNELILEWLRSSGKSGQVKIALLSGPKALIGLTTLDKWAKEWRDYQAEQYYFRSNMFQLFFDAWYYESKYSPQIDPGSRNGTSQTM
jgi:hypothetical protein